MLKSMNILLITIFLTKCLTDGRLHKGTVRCEKYDGDSCKYNECETTVEECADLRYGNNKSLDDPENYMLCFASWMKDDQSSEPILLKKGCWMNADKCKNQNRCVSDKGVSDVYFCCCDGNLCNQNFYHEPSVSEDPEDIKADSELPRNDVTRKSDDEQVTNVILYTILPLLAIALIVATVFFLWRKHRHHVGHTQLPTVDPSLAPTPSKTSLNIQLLELKAVGRFGKVWKAQLLDQCVAVKIFPLCDRDSWVAEVDIYNLPLMQHENILEFIGSESKERVNCKEFWLISKYHEYGSVYDYLKANTITWSQMCRMAETMASGLAYLHDEIPSSYKEKSKPAIAHRDFKSKNVLLKNDLTTCIGDFGLALKLGGGIPNETHTLVQVGTRRYMAPEILEGAICFNRDSFLRIDMYACGMVLWELMTRCALGEGPVGEFRLPFEVEVGLRPTLEVMQTCVITQKARPTINPLWLKHQGMSQVVATIQDCWDQDAEARLSASCVQERISYLSRTVNTGNEAPAYEPSNNLPPQQVAPLVSTVVRNPPSFVPPSISLLQEQARIKEVDSC